MDTDIRTFIIAEAGVNHNGDIELAKKLIEVLGPRYKDRKGGYLRITKVVKRASDGRSHAVIEFIK